MGSLNGRWKRGCPALAILVGLLACGRNFDGPFLPSSPDYAGSDWTRDSNGDGVADSVAKYAPDCTGDAGSCLKLAQARASKAVPDKPGQIPVPAPDPKPPSILVDSITAPDMILLPGETKTPQIQVFPPGATDRSFQLVSGNQSVATVSSGGVFGAAAGIIMMDAQSLDGGGVKGSFQVTVAPRPAKLEAKSLRLTVGSAPAAPDLVFTPSEASFNGYAISGGDVSIAAISVDGKTVRPVAAGQTSFQVAVTGYDNISGTLSVTVDPAAVPVRAVHVDDMSLVVTDPLSPVQSLPVALWDPADATDKSYSLASDNPLVAHIVGDAVESGLPGQTQVTLTSTDGAKRATFTVKVSLSQGVCVSLTGDCQPNGNGNGKGKGKG